MLDAVNHPKRRIHLEEKEFISWLE